MCITVLERKHVFRYRSTRNGNKWRRWTRPKVYFLISIICLWVLTRGDYIWCIFLNKQKLRTVEYIFYRLLVLLNNYNDLVCWFFQKGITKFWGKTTILNRFKFNTMSTDPLIFFFFFRSIFWTTWSMDAVAQEYGQRGAKITPN